MPQICRRCSTEGQQMKNHKEEAYKICQVADHETKDCPKIQICNLYGLAAHRYKDCPMRERTWPLVAAKAQAIVNPTPAQVPVAAKPKEKPEKEKEGKRTLAPVQHPCPFPPPCPLTESHFPISQPQRSCTQPPFEPFLPSP